MPLKLFVSIVVLLTLGTRFGASQQIAMSGTPGTIIASAPVTLLPDPTRQPLTILRVGTSVTMLEAEGDWVYIHFNDARYGPRFGYVRREHVRMRQTPPIAPQSAPDRTSSSAVASIPLGKPSQPATQSASGPVSRSSAPAATSERPSASVDLDRVREAPAAAANGTLTNPLTPAVPRDAGERRIRPFTDQQIAANIQIGLKARGRTQGLVLEDSFKRFTAALTAGGTGPTASNGFSVTAYTPLAWVRQLASDAAKEYRQFGTESVSDEMLEPMFRVVAFPDTPNTVTAEGLRGTASVQHVVLRDESRKIVVQPVSKEPFVQEAANAMGGRASFEGLRLKFRMEDVRELRGTRGDREFFITVIGSTREEKDFRVRKRHFDDLP
jgi:hypothetical protein